MVITSVNQPFIEDIDKNTSVVVTVFKTPSKYFYEALWEQGGKVIASELGKEHETLKSLENELNKFEDVKIILAIEEVA